MNARNNRCKSRVALRAPCGTSYANASQSEVGSWINCICLPISIGISGTGRTPTYRRGYARWPSWGDGAKSNCRLAQQKTLRANRKCSPTYRIGPRRAKPGPARERHALGIKLALGRRQAEIFAERSPLILRTKQTSPLKLGDKAFGDVTSAARKIARH
jgi:hypothetical protein